MSQRTHHRLFQRGVRGVYFEPAHAVYAFDLESYCKERDFYCDYASFVPGRIVRTMEELTHALQTEDYQQEKVAPFYTRNLDDTAGKATQNVVHFAKELLHIPTDHPTPINSQ